MDPIGLGRMTLIEKLERLQLSEEDFEFYCSTFIKNWSRYNRKESHGDWFLVKNKRGRPVYLPKDVVANHLLGKFSIATFPDKLARYFCLDIDQSSEKMAIYRSVKKWLGAPLVFQSSTSGGLHIYAHLAPDFPISVQKLLSITEATCKATRINLSPGVCEVFPRPGKALRLPLGPGSFLLDPESLSPICTDVGTALRHMSKNIKYYSFQDLFPQLARRIDEKKRLRERGL